MKELKPAEKAERRLVRAILAGDFAVGDALPAERQLAGQLGVTRPTLREALQRMGRDGWVEIQQGKPTRVKDFLRDGSLGVLQSLISVGDTLPEGFIGHVLLVRALLAPTYAGMAVGNEQGKVVAFLRELVGMAEKEGAAVADFADGDGGLHKLLADCSGNPIFSLILNGFMPLYPAMGRAYFASAAARDYSRDFYVEFLRLAEDGDVRGVERLVGRVMQEAINFWQDAN